jgi:hypothetical protein
VGQGALQPGNAWLGASTLQLGAAQWGAGALQLGAAQWGASASQVVAIATSTSVKTGQCFCHYAACLRHFFILLLLANACINMSRASCFVECFTHAAALASQQSICFPYS